MTSLPCVLVGNQGTGGPNITLAMVESSSGAAPARATNEAMVSGVAGSISVNRDLTNLALIRLITAASAFWLALQLCRDRPRAILLLTSIAAIGSLYSVLALVSLKAGQPAWLDMPANPGRISATFINHNSFATFAGISLVALTGLLLNLYRREVVARPNWRLSLASLIETTGQRGAVLLAGGFVTLVALLWTGSRGGVIATGLGLLFLLALQQRARHHDRLSLGLILAGSVLLAATIYAFGGILFSNLDERGISDASRISAYLLMLRSILDAPLAGFGYGTFVDVFPLYRDRSISVLGVWGQAHDTYLEVLQGLGLVFGGLLIATVALLALRCARGALTRQENAMIPAVAASAACLVGIHTVVDFSLQMQAVALTLMAILGAGTAQSESSRLSLQD